MVTRTTLRECIEVVLAEFVKAKGKFIECGRQRTAADSSQPHAYPASPWPGKQRQMAHQQK
jgi:hypothetical protein